MLEGRSLQFLERIVKSDIISELFEAQRSQMEKHFRRLKHLLSATCSASCIPCYLSYCWRQVCKVGIIDRQGKRDWERLSDLCVTMEESELELGVGLAPEYSLLGLLSGRLVQMCVSLLKLDLLFKLLGYTVLSPFSLLQECQINLFCAVFNPQLHCFWIVVFSLGCMFSITWDGIGWDGMGWGTGIS